MSIEVYYHGITAEVTGKSKEMFDPVRSVGMLKSGILRKHPDLKTYAFVMAVNGTILHDLKKPLKNGDRISLIPPMPGG